METVQKDEVKSKKILAKIAILGKLAKNSRLYENFHGFCCKISLTVLRFNMFSKPSQIFRVFPHILSKPKENYQSMISFVQGNLFDGGGVKPKIPFRFLIFLLREFLAR